MIEDNELKLINSIVNKIDMSIEKMDYSIDKLSDVTKTISDLVIIHEQRINVLDNTSKDVIRDLKEVNLKINAFQVEFIKELNNFSDKLEQKIDKSINDRCDELEIEVKNLHKRITTLEQSKHWVLGVCAAVSFIIALALSYYK